LEGLSEVINVEFIKDKDYFIVRYNSTTKLTARFSEAISSQIVVPGVRKALGNVGGSEDRPTL